MGLSPFWVRKGELGARVLLWLSRGIETIAGGCLFNLAKVKDSGTHGPLAGFRRCLRVLRESQPNHAFHAWHV